MRELIIDALLNIQKRTKTDKKIWQWHEYRFMYDENLKENLESMSDQELFSVYNKIYGNFCRPRG